MIGALYPQYFENKAIVICKTTSEYFQYLFERWDCLHTNVRLARPNSAGAYVLHRPETTLLYQIVREYWPEFQTELTSHGRYLPAYVTKEFDEYLKCGRLEYGFLRVRCESCHDEKLVAFSCKKRGFRLKAPCILLLAVFRQTL